MPRHVYSDVKTKKNIFCHLRTGRHVCGGRTVRVVEGGNIVLFISYVCGAKRVVWRGCMTDDGKVVSDGEVVQDGMVVRDAMVAQDRMVLPEEVVHNLMVVPDPTVVPDGMVVPDEKLVQDREVVLDDIIPSFLNPSRPLCGHAGRPSFLISIISGLCYFFSGLHSFLFSSCLLSFLHPFLPFFVSSFPFTSSSPLSGLPSFYFLRSSFIPSFLPPFISLSLIIPLPFTGRM